MCPARFWQPTCWCEIWKLRCEDCFLLAGQLQRFVVQRQLARGETKNAPECKLLLRLKPSHVLVSLPLLEQLSYYLCHGKSAQGQGCNMAARDYLLKVYGPPHLEAGSLRRRVSSEHLTDVPAAAKSSRSQIHVEKGPQPRHVLGLRARSEHRGRR